MTNTNENVTITTGLSPSAVRSGRSRVGQSAGQSVEFRQTPQAVYEAMQTVAAYLREESYECCVVSHTGGGSFLQTAPRQKLIDEYEALTKVLAENLHREERKNRGFFKRLAEAWGSNPKRTVFFYKGTAYQVSLSNLGSVSKTIRAGWENLT